MLVEINHCALIWQVPNINYLLTLRAITQCGLRSARRMAEGAAALNDEVIQGVPVRQATESAVVLGYGLLPSIVTNGSAESLALLSLQGSMSVLRGRAVCPLVLAELVRGLRAEIPRFFYAAEIAAAKMLLFLRESAAMDILIKRDKNAKRQMSAIAPALSPGAVLPHELQHQAISCLTS